MVSNGKTMTFKKNSLEKKDKGQQVTQMKPKNN